MSSFLVNHYVDELNRKSKIKPLVKALIDRLLNSQSPFLKKTGLIQNQLQRHFNTVKYQLESQG